MKIETQNDPKRSRNTNGRQKNRRYNMERDKTRNRKFTIQQIKNGNETKRQNNNPKDKIKGCNSI